MGRVGSYPTFSSLPCGGIFLLHLSWGHPRRALPVILALWSPDFPHLGPFGAQPRLSNLVAEILYPNRSQLSNPLANSFPRGYTIYKYKEWRMAMMIPFEAYFENLRGKRVAVLGLGVSNRPLVRHPDPEQRFFCPSGTRNMFQMQKS